MSNRELAFFRAIAIELGGLQYYTPNDKGIERSGDTLRYRLKRGAASNKAGAIEFTPAADGQINVVFLKKDGTLVSQHAGVPYDGLVKLLYEQAGIIVRGPDKDPRGPSYVRSRAFDGS